MGIPTKYFFGQPIVPQRIYTPLDRGYKIESYGVNNLYPQYQEQLRLASPLIKSATEILADFLNGEGFEQNGDVILNDNGEEANDVLNMAAMDMSIYSGFALWLGFNGGGKIEQIQHVPFEFCRFGLPNALGKHDTIAVSNNWDSINSDYQSLTPEDVAYYPIFNPLTAAEDTISGGSGQILYFTKQKDKYNLSTFDAINNTAECDNLIQLFERNQSKSGFNGTVLFKYPGEIEDSEEGIALTGKIESMQGADSPGVLLAQVDEDFTGNLIETVAPLNADGLFPLTRQAIIDRVLMNFRIPGGLFGVQPSGGVFNATSYKESFTTYSIITRNGRKKIARVFNTLGALMATATDFGEIIENSFSSNGEEMQEQPNQFNSQEEEPEVIEETEEVEAKLKKLYG